jgi:predicted nucleic acid-binding Zn ribbon protein
MPFYDFKCVQCDVIVTPELDRDDVWQYGKTWTFECDACHGEMKRKYSSFTFKIQGVDTPYIHPANGKMVSTVAEERAAIADYEEKWGEKIVNVPDDDYWFTPEQAEKAEENRTKTFERQAAASGKTVEEVKAVTYHRKAKKEEFIGRLG